MEFVCRICTEISEEEHLQSIFCTNIAEKLRVFMNLRQNDEFPKRICSKCIIELNEAYDFRRKCIVSDAKILHMLKNEKIKARFEIALLNLGDLTSNVNKELPVNSQISQSSNIENNVQQIEEKDNSESNKSPLISGKKQYFMPTEDSMSNEDEELPADSHLLQTSDTDDDDNTEPIKSPIMKNQIVIDCSDLSIDLEKSKKYKCEECSKSFAFQSNLKDHMKRAHTTEYKCQQCFKQFKHKGLLQLHAKTHNIYKCPQCPKEFFKKYRMLKHLRIHSADKHSFACSICSKLYTEYGNLLRHQRTHTGVRPFVCEMCGSAFTQKTSLQSHMKTHDRLQTAIKNNFVDGLNCKLCDEQTTFASAKYLLAHLTRCHSYSTADVIPRSVSNKMCETRDYKCTQCNKCYLTKGQLNIHSASHLSVKPYLCEECGRTFSVKAQLNTHMMIHTNSKPYKCEECGMNFRLQSTLTTHFRQHSGSKPYVCKICNRPFRQMQHLRRHMRCHTGEKPYSCEICGKRFVDKNNVVVHMRQHTGDKPYKCQHCDMAFYDAPNLRKHSLKHNKLKETS